MPPRAASGTRTGTGTVAVRVAMLQLLLCAKLSSCAAAGAAGQPGPGRAAAAAAAGAPVPGYPNCTDGGGERQGMYSVSVVQRDPVPDSAALISHANGSSAFNFSFTTAWFPAPSAGSSAGRGAVVGDGLIVRVVECTNDHHSCAGVSHPEWTNAGALTVVHADMSGEGAPTAAHVGYSNVFWAGVTPPPHSTSGGQRGDPGKWGAADPRVAYRDADGTYFLTWDNCTKNCYPHRTTLLSTTKDPFDHKSWTCHGPLLPGVYTGGASLLIRDKASPAGAPHLAFVGDSDTANRLLLAESQDGISWAQPANESKRVFMSSRPGCWDAAGVAAGPQPARLSTGDYLYIYNIDTGFPYRANPLGRCAVGWAILDKDDPTRIVARSEGALITPSLPWETCGGEKNKGPTCQEPLVAFSTGMKPLGNDEFYVLYGAADTDVGVTRIKVHVQGV